MSAAQPRREAVDAETFNARKVPTGRPALSPYDLADARQAYCEGLSEDAGTFRAQTFAFECAEDDADEIADAAITLRHALDAFLLTVSLHRRGKAGEPDDTIRVLIAENLQEAGDGRDMAHVIDAAFRSVQS